MYKQISIARFLIDSERFRSLSPLSRTLRIIKISMSPKFVAQKERTHMMCCCGVALRLSDIRPLRNEA